MSPSSKKHLPKSATPHINAANATRPDERERTKTTDRDRRDSSRQNKASGSVGCNSGQRNTSRGDASHGTAEDARRRTTMDGHMLVSQGSSSHYQYMWRMRAESRRAWYSLYMLQRVLLSLTGGRKTRVGEHRHLADFPSQMMACRDERTVELD
jgi:hypothetical protein